MPLREYLEYPLSYLGYPHATHSFINHLSEFNFQVAPSATISRGCYLRGDINLAERSRLATGCVLNGKISIGRQTNIEPNTEMIGDIEIGKYCAIARKNLFQQKNHNTKKPAMQMRFYKEILDSQLEHMSNGPIKIGHDVWIGTRTIILSGVNVGHGAIIGAGSVVTNDVEPYSIVAGTPAQRINYRFSEDVRESLIDIAWWDWSIEKIKENKEFFETEIRTVDDIETVKS